MRKNVRSLSERKEQAVKLIEFGAYLYDLRDAKGLTLQLLADELNVSANYISELERGKKNPSDEMIQDIAEFFEIDEKDLFDIIGRIPLRVLEEIKKSPQLKESLQYIAELDMDDEQKKRAIYGNMVYNSRVQ